MATLPQDRYTTMRDLKWSHSEKTIARKAFKQALGREFEAVMQEAKQRAAKIEQPSDLWNLEAYLTDKRKEIDRKYDYRYSVLPHVFGNLVREGRLGEEELRGLRQDKLELVRSYVKVLAELDAVA
jgi:Photoprotection regulator fluorescence recovery protein